MVCLLKSNKKLIRSQSMTRAKSLMNFKALHIMDFVVTDMMKLILNNDVNNIYFRYQRMKAIKPNNEKKPTHHEHIVHVIQR